MDKDYSIPAEDFVAAERRELEERLAELRPAVAEAERIERRLRTLAALPHGSSGRSNRRRFSTESRALQVLNLLARSPGSNRSAVASTLGVQASRAGKIVAHCLANDLIREDQDARLFLTNTAYRKHQRLLGFKAGGFFEVELPE